MIRIRKARAEDRPRILEISSKIWEGDDYVPELLDAWLADEHGELAIAAWEDQVIAFAHRTWLCPGIAWLEGIRTDPEWEGRGAAKAITDHFIRGAANAGASSIHLSAYVENEASIHIIESYGFTRIATFCYVERAAMPATDAVPKHVFQIQHLEPEHLLKFVDQSDFLSLAQRQFPRGWRFYPFDHNPRDAVSRLAYCTGAWEDGALVAALCIRQGAEHAGTITINFLDGALPAMQALLAEALDCYAGKAFEMMMPVQRGRHASALGILKDTGFTSWSGFKPDVFVYQRPVSESRRASQT